MTAKRNSNKKITGSVDEAFIEAAKMRLQGAQGPKDAREAVREIVANLLGSEEMGLFKLDEAKGALWSYWSFGIPLEHEMLDVFSQPALKSVLEGEILIDSIAESTKVMHGFRPVNAFVPILMQGKVVAVLMIFRLLRQKRELNANDRALLQAISDYAGPAMFPKRRKPFLTQLLENNL